MKTLSKILSLFAVSLLLLLSPSKANAQVSVNFQLFYDDLSPYGYWVNYPSYGYVWVPNAGAGFVPYGTNGYWVYTEFGWTWVSDYPWGWAPFHYGRWFYDPLYGNLWVPGNDWGPGWVVWRNSGGYYGWAPIEPGISLNVAYGSGYNVPVDRWSFVRSQDFGRRNINNYFVASTARQSIYSKSVLIDRMKTDGATNVRYAMGPDKNDVQKLSGRNIVPVNVKTINKPDQRINKNQLELYRPTVRASSEQAQHPAPRKISQLSEVKAARESKAVNTRAATSHSPTKNEQRAAHLVASPKEKTASPHAPANNPQRNAHPAASPKEMPQPLHDRQPARNSNPLERNLPMQQQQKNNGLQQHQRENSSQPHRNTEQPHMMSQPSNRGPAPVMRNSQPATIPMHNENRPPQQMQQERNAPMQNSEQRNSPHGPK